MEEENSCGDPKCSCGGIPVRKSDGEPKQNWPASNRPIIPPL